MRINLVPFALLWAAIALETLAVWIWNGTVAVPVERRASLLNGMPIAQQRRIAGKLDRMDRWGHRLTVFTLVFGAVLAAAYLYQG